MSANPKTPWPATYLGRLEAVINELQSLGQPASVEMVLERFSGVTLEQVEGTLAALVLFGRIDKKDDLFSVAKDN